MPNLKRVPLEGKNQFQICRKVTTLSCKGCSRNSIGKCDVYGVSGKRGKKERKFILGPIRARNTTGRNECCFHRRTIRAEFQGSLNKSLDRAIIIENRGRGCCSNNEPLGENGQNRRKIALVVPRISSPKLDPESARVREKVCFKFDRSSGIYSGIYVESTSCLSPR